MFWEGLTRGSNHDRAADCGLPKSGIVPLWLPIAILQSTKSLDMTESAPHTSERGRGGAWSCAEVRDGRQSAEELGSGDCRVHIINKMRLHPKALYKRRGGNNAHKQVYPGVLWSCCQRVMSEEERRERANCRVPMQARRNDGGKAQPKLRTAAAAVLRHTLGLLRWSISGQRVFLSPNQG